MLSWRITLQTVWSSFLADNLVGVGVRKQGHVLAMGHWIKAGILDLRPHITDQFYGPGQRHFFTSVGYHFPIRNSYPLFPQYLNLLG